MIKLMKSTFYNEEDILPILVGRLRETMLSLVESKKIGEFEDKSLLIVDDDNPFRERLSRAME